MSISISQLTGKTDEHIHYYANNIGIHHHVYPQWESLCEAAKTAGFELTIASGFRSFERQLSIWNRKFSGELPVNDIHNNRVNIKELSEEALISAILTFSALPGASRHHWGTDIDFYDKKALKDGQNVQLESWEYEKGGPFFDLTTWIKANAYKFGFYFPYDKFREGIASEPWHLSYFPLANQFEALINENSLTSALAPCNILGKESIIDTIEHILNQYVLNINHTTEKRSNNHG